MPQAKFYLKNHRRELILLAIAVILGIFLYLDRQRATPAELSMSLRLSELSKNAALPVFFGEDGNEVPIEGSTLYAEKKVCFSVSTSNKLPNDVYCGLIKTGKDGKFSVRKLVNLSDTKDGDESVLTVNRNWVAWASSVRDRFKSVSISRSSGTYLRYFTFKPSVKNVTLEWNAEGHLVVSYLSAETQKEAVINPISAEVTPLQSELTFSPEIKGNEHWLSSLVNYVRGIVGADAITWVEEKYFDAKDRFDGWYYRKFNKTETDAAPQAMVPSGKAVLPGLKPIIEDGKFPLEGVWTTEGLSQAISGKPVLMAKTFVRPDKERPYAKVFLLYIDAAQVKLVPVAGTEHPKPTTGIRGKGTIPMEGEVRGRLLSAFSGGFQALHGNYGMMVNGEIYLPAVDGIATVCFYSDNSIRLGVWGKDVFDTPALVSFRQNLPMLITGGKYNRDNKFWGYTPKLMKSSHTWRTGLGLTANKKIIYALGSSVVAETLASAMIQAGVVSGMQLDMNMSNVSCEIYAPSKNEKGELTVATERLCEGLILKKGLFLKPYTRDFFYVTRKKGY